MALPIGLAAATTGCQSGRTISSQSVKQPENMPLAQPEQDLRVRDCELTARDISVSTRANSTSLISRTAITASRRNGRTMRQD